MVIEHPELRRPVIHGLLREGETMNVIASPKVGKSWLVNDLALAVATGRQWLETFETEQGNVLIIDNELHRETSAHRIPKVMDARGIPFDDVGDRICVANVRGGLKDIYGLATCFQELSPDRFKLIVLDAFYRFMPRDTDENDNGTMSQLYNHLDNFAARLHCSFVLVHHSSKGSQSGKSVTDVGAGAGSQSRATDTHLVLRPHEEPNCAVLDAAVRSWPPIEPRVLRWQFPVWNPDDSLDPADLQTARARRRRSGARARARTDEPALKAQITKKAKEQGLSARKASRLLRAAEEAELVFRWKFGVTKSVQFATEAQPAGSSVRARTPP
ncbi:Regulatory protein RepA [Symmachiella macrocystis]|uniref:Regulatory protein RepA n=1 Tax=Symmachiella macrocystis TaxID=2527985 RepID=A0A5C6BVL3_9PLAN|nr:AAA family ATPase [Symmachiella macrocystis]TWU14744.1 Regulatory protein RepA [Symmachiella macrocystis]